MRARRSLWTRVTASAGAAALVTAMTALAGCAASAPDGGDAVIEVTSDAFAGGDTIGDEFTCRGEGGFPGIAWTGDLGDASAIAVVVDDPDAPGGTFTHLVVLDLPPTTTSLVEPFPDDAVVAVNSAGTSGWTPPCPPSGEHRYRFTVHALDGATGLEPGATLDEALAAIDDATVSSGTLTGLVAA